MLAASTAKERTLLMVYLMKLSSVIFLMSFFFLNFYS